MDVRDSVIDLVFGDVVLRPLLVNYANRLERPLDDEYGPVGSCSLRLAWPTDGSPAEVTGQHLLLAEAHMPWQSAPHDPFFAFVLDRLRATLSGATAAGTISTRFLPAPTEHGAGPCGTIFHTAAFEIGPPLSGRGAPARPAQAPWDAGRAGTAAPAPRTPTSGTPGLD